MVSSQTAAPVESDLPNGKMANGAVAPGKPKSMLAVYCESEMHLLDRKMAAYTALAPEDQEVLAEYRERLQSLAVCVTANGRFLKDLNDHGASFLQDTPPVSPHPANENGAYGKEKLKESDAELASIMPVESNVDSSAREAEEAEAEELRDLFSLCTREWSTQGAPVRDTLYAPLLSAVEEAYQDASRASRDLLRRDFRVLVPGAGAGRLPWELARRGYAVEGSEGSAARLLAANYFLNHASTSQARDIYPHAHSHANVRSAAAQLAGVRVPDVSASEAYEDADAEFGMRTGPFIDVYADVEGCAHAIASCLAFELDENIMGVVRRVSSLLQPGGIWAFLGPRPAVHGDDTLAVQLSVPEMVAILKKCGFRIVKEKNVLCPLEAGDASLRNRCVNATFFVAMKVRPMK